MLRCVPFVHDVGIGECFLAKTLTIFLAKTSEVMEALVEMDLRGGLERVSIQSKSLRRERILHHQEIPIARPLRGPCSQQIYR
jgi:hypothetical protein